MTLSIDYAEKLRAIRKAEKLTQKRFSEITGISPGTVRNYESGISQARAEIMEKVVRVELFEKYTIWLIHDKTAPAAGQIAPALSLSGSDGSEAKGHRGETGEGKAVKSSRSARKIG